MLFVGELLQPVIYTSKSVWARGIKEHKRKVNVLQKERVNWPEIGLACKVPQHRLTLCTIVTHLSQFIHNPKLLSMGRLGDLKAIFRNSITETRFAHSTIANQCDFCRGVMYRASNRGRT